MANVFTWLAIMLAVFGAAAPAGAQGLFFGMPLECDMKRDCFIQQYFDHDPSSGYRDYACGTLSYDEHTGTDFRVRDLVQMREGVPVLAAAAGTVRAVRDGMDDVSVRETGVEGLDGRLAGNSVVLVHAGGVETQYSHLRKGSVRVRPGDAVRAGQVLGLVGLSGRTEFPHLEFSVRVDGRPVDPFKGLDDAPLCGLGAAPLWSAEALARLPYEPTRLLALGFADDAPTVDGVANRRYEGGRLAPDAAALIFWVRLAGLGRGDVLELELFGPGGRSLTRKSLTLDRSKAQAFRFIGIKRRAASWPEGEYAGRFVLRRPSAHGWTTVCDVTRRLTVGK